MWKIFVVILTACADPTYVETPYTYPTLEACEAGIRFQQAQLRNLSGSHIICRKT
jgi:hypothetical protein